MEQNLSNFINSFYIFVGDLLTLDDLPQIEFNEELETACGYNFNNRSIIINFSKFANDNPFFIFACLAHELRHAYQHQCLEQNQHDCFSDDELDLLQTELLNYTSHGADYKNQFIELDAFGFAEFIVRKCFNIKLTYNATFSKEEIDRIYDKAEQFDQLYTQDEILECMEYAGFTPVPLKKDFN